MRGFLCPTVDFLEEIGQANPDGSPDYHPGLIVVRYVHTKNAPVCPKIPMINFLVKVSWLVPLRSSPLAMNLCSQGENGLQKYNEIWHECVLLSLV